MYVRSIHLRFLPEQLGRGVDVLHRSYSQAVATNGSPLGALMTDVMESSEVDFITHWQTLAEAQASPVLSFVLEQLGCAGVLQDEPQSQIDELT